MPKPVTPQHPSLYPERFDLIDAFRGLAALAVVIHHVIGGHDPRFQIGHPAVIVFFVISGYCIASAADLIMLGAAVAPTRVRSAVAALIVASVAWIAIFPTVCYGLFIEYWAMFGVGGLVFYRLCRLKTGVWRRAAEAVIVGLFLVS